MLECVLGEEITATNICGITLTACSLPGSLLLFSLSLSIKEGGRMGGCVGVPLLGCRCDDRLNRRPPLCLSRSPNGAGSASSPSEAEAPPSHRSSFVRRVLWVALPLQLFLLLLVGLACLVPWSEGDFSCSQSNTFARSFFPMLRYTNGPPPV